LQSRFTAENGQKLIEKRGIEVGNIFQLGFHYSTKMKDAVFTDERVKNNHTTWDVRFWTGAAPSQPLLNNI